MKCCEKRKSTVFCSLWNHLFFQTFSDFLIIGFKYRTTCKAKRICGTSCTHQSAYKCSLCSECTLHCSDFVEDVCSVKNKPPYVCNGCSQLPKCTLLKRIYDLADEHERAHHAVSEARTGIMSNEDDIARINRIISPLGELLGYK